MVTARMMISSVGRHQEWAAEHRAIMGAVRAFALAAESDGDENCIRLAAELSVHAQLEEEVLYPAAVLVGELVKAKLQPQRTSA